MMKAALDRIVGVVGSFRAHGVLLLVAGLGIASSVAVIPRGSELGLLNLALGRSGKALADLERQYAGGDRSPATLAAVAAARFRTGDLPGATDLLETLLVTRPQDVSLLQTLAEYYRRMGRHEAELAMMEKVQSIRPSKASLQVLARLYGEFHRTAEQRLALQELVARGQAEPSNFLELASVEGATGHPADGAEMIGRLEVFWPRAMDTSIVALEMSLRLNAGQAEWAFQRAKSWFDKARRPDREILSLASVLSVHGQAQLAARLLGPVAERTGDQTIILARAQAEFDAGQGEQVLRRIELFADAHHGLLEPDLAWYRLRLAAALSEHVRTADAAEALAPLPIPNDHLAIVAVAARRTGRPALAAVVRDQLARTRVGLERILVAEVYLAMGERREATEWANLAAPDARDNAEVATRLARVELRLMRKSQALAALRSGLPFSFADARRIERRPGVVVAPGLLVPIARLYVEMDLAMEGLAVLQQLRQERASREADWAWALTAVAARREAMVSAWLRSAAAQAADPECLRELVSLSAQKGEGGVALGAAARLASTRGTEPDRLLLAELQASSSAPWVRLEAARLEQATVVSR
jgi:tetratricopeptide (TPR) repeat protein